MNVDRFGAYPNPYQAPPASKNPTPPQYHFSLTHGGDEFRLNVHAKSSDGPLSESHLRRYAEQVGEALRILSPGHARDTGNSFDPDAFEHRPLPPPSDYGGNHGSDIVEFSSGTRTPPAVVRDLVEHAESKPPSWMGRMMSVPMKVTQVVYDASSFVVGKGAGVVRWGLREATHNPMGALMLLIAAHRGLIGRHWIPNRLERNINWALQRSPDGNPIPVMLAKAMGAALNTRERNRLFQAVQSVVQPNSRSTLHKARDTAEFVLHKVSPAVEHVVKNAVANPVGTAGAGLAAGTLLGGNKSKLGNGLVRASRAMLRALDVIAYPFARRWTRGHHWS